MSWHWVPDRPPSGSASAEDLGLQRRFSTQGEAESWLGEFYPDLVIAEISAVTLYEEDRLVYGPMRLDS